MRRNWKVKDCCILNSLAVMRLAFTFFEEGEHVFVDNTGDKEHGDIDGDSEGD